ncbi:MAG: hypothetical protein PHU85_03205, partial [Phycisphaerae bacterium]|nr:hypothetical protein [Phycisphaerae bacterium]
MILTRRSRRLLAYGILTLLGLAPFLTVLAGGLYLRSPLHRHALERRLSAFFGLPTRVGRVVPRSWAEMDLYNIEIFLPNGGARFDPALRVARCAKAEWLRSTTSPGRFDLILTGGTLDLTPAHWAKGDFKLLEKSLRHDYPDLRLGGVRIVRSGIRWGHGDFAIELSGAEGYVWFQPTGPSQEGLASLTASHVNGQPGVVKVTATLNPITDALADGAGGSLVREFTLSTAPNHTGPIQLRQFHLDKLTGKPVASGEFSGTLSYRAFDGPRRHVFTIRDAMLRGVQLAELTPLSGLVDLTVNQLQFEQAASPPATRPQYVLSRLDIAGSLREFDLAAAMSLADLPPCSGRLDLSLERAALEAGRPIVELRAAGRAAGLDLAQLTGLLPAKYNGGRVHGRARLEDFKLRISDGLLRQAEADLIADGPATGAGVRTIDLKLIEAVAPIIGKINGLTGTAPDSIAYRDMKIRAANDTGPGLLLLGAGGSDGKALM